MHTIFLYICSTVLIGFLLFMTHYFFMKNRHLEILLSKIPGPKCRYPLLGNLDIFWRKDIPLNQSIYQTLIALTIIFQKEGIFKFHLGHKNIVCVFRHETIEPILTSNTNIDKAKEYDLFIDWVGRGLLTSNGSFWRCRRKLLSPAFHFKILEDFMPIMNEQTDILVNVLREATKKEFIDIPDIIIPCTLDIICETVMGISIGAQMNTNQEYLEAVRSLMEIYLNRSFTPWLWPDLIFYRTKNGKKFKSLVERSRGLTRKVINERKAELVSNQGNAENISSKVDEKADNIYMSNKNRKRLVFIDLLLNHHMTDNSLSLEDIREEVDTFLFAGHDTIAISLTWGLYLLGLHPEVQIKIKKELEDIFGYEIDRNITSDDLKRMTYLECVIKESLRLISTVPYIGREITEDLQIGDYVIPKGVNMLILLNSDPKVFSDPLKFKPERFETENTSNMNAYSYVPFSAGPRGCIGKKFALIEMKIILSKIFLNFNTRSLDQRDKILTSAEPVNRNLCPVRIQIIPKENFL